jgi:hypothetical protein
MGSLEGHKEKRKAQERDYAFRISLWETKVPCKLQPKDISFFRGKKGGGTCKAK